MSKIVYVMDSRVSNTPVELGSDTVEELERRICTLCEDYCIITTESLSLARVDVLRRVMKASDKRIAETNEKYLTAK